MSRNRAGPFALDIFSQRLIEKAWLHGARSMTLHSVRRRCACLFTLRSPRVHPRSKTCVRRCSSKPIERSPPRAPRTPSCSRPTRSRAACEAYAAAESDLARGRNIDRIRSALATATRVVHAGRRRRRDRERDARVASSRRAPTRPTPTRPRSRPSFGPKPAKRFDTAARRLETGDIRGARSRADEAEALYRDAELTAIKAQYLSQTRALLAEAEQARVPRLAPKHLREGAVAARAKPSAS